MITKQPWSTVALLDGDGDAIPEGDDQTRVRYLIEYRKHETMSTVYFAERFPGQDIDDMSEWGPRYGEIDWSGFPS